MNSTQKIAFLGAGKMAQAIFSRVISSKLFDPANIYVSDIDRDLLNKLSQEYEVNTGFNQDVVSSADIIVLCVKPQNIDELLNEVFQEINEKLVISIVAGIKISKIENYLPNASVIRVMPNINAIVGKAISAISAGKNASSADLTRAQGLLFCVGEVIIVKEEMMDAVTAISGSGPAYFFFFVEELVKAGRDLGFAADVAYKLVSETFYGCAELLEVSGKRPQELREMVTSKGGTTEKALAEFKSSDLGGIIKNAAQKAFERARELSK